MESWKSLPNESCGNLKETPCMGSRGEKSIHPKETPCASFGGEWGLSMQMNLIKLNIKGEKTKLLGDL